MHNLFKEDNGKFGIIAENTMERVFSGFVIL